MLLVEVKTNLPDAKVTADLEEKCVKKLSALTGVPTKQITVVVYTELYLRMYQSTAPFVLLRAWAEGDVFTAAKNKKFGDPMIDLLSGITGVPDSRVAINFHPLDPGMQSIVPATGSW